MSRDEQILQALESAQALLEEEEPLLAFYERLTRAIMAHKRTLRDSNALPTEQIFQAGEASALARAGMPHLTWQALALDAASFYAWLQRVATLWDDYDPGAAEELEGIDAPRSVALAEEWFREGATPRGPTVDAMLINALAPYLEEAAETLLPLLPLHIWEQAYCPVCGGLPDFALWDDAEETQHLVCERCRAEWDARVVGCLFCGETDPEQRGFYSTEDERYRVEVCDSCGFYVKGIDQQALEPGEHPTLAAERLLTPGLDLLALQEGYARPEGIGAGEE